MGRGQGAYYNSIYPNYAQARGRNRQLLGKIALRPLMFTFGDLNGQYHGDVNNSRVCRSRYDTLCVRLGVPPTMQVANPRWHLSSADAGLAFRYVDAYVWAGRPWLVGPAGSFDMQRAVGLASSTPF